MDMHEHIRGGATRHPAKSARPIRVALAWRAASLHALPDSPAGASTRAWRSHPSQRQQR